VMTADALILATILFNDSGKADALRLREALTHAAVTLP
jgi:hypothetical protein